VTEFETEEMRPVKARCTKDEVHVTLADERTISAPLWWYPFLSGLDEQGLNEIDLMYKGIWWTKVDEGISVKSMFLGVKAPEGQGAGEGGLIDAQTIEDIATEFGICAAGALRKTRKSNEIHTLLAEGSPGNRGLA